MISNAARMQDRILLDSCSISSAKGMRLDVIAGRDGLDAQRAGEVWILPVPGSPQWVDDIVARLEVEPGSGFDALLVERWLESEIKRLQGLDRGQARCFQIDVYAPAFAQRDLLTQQLLDESKGAELTIFQAGYVAAYVGSNLSLEANSIQEFTLEA